MKDFLKRNYEVVTAIGRFLGVVIFLAVIWFAIPGLLGGFDGNNQDEKDPIVELQEEMKAEAYQDYLNDKAVEDADREELMRSEGVEY